MIPAILSIVIVISIFYLIICFLIANGFAASNRKSKSLVPKITYQNVSFYSHPDEVLLKGWYFPSESKNTIVVMHGGKQNRSQPGIGLINLCETLNKQGYSILTFDRRGCGESDSSKLNTKACLDRDFAGAINYIKNKNGLEENIYLWGTSIGAVSALSFVAKTNEVNAIIADSCFADIPEMSSRVLKNTFPAFIVFMPGSIYMGRHIFGMEKDRPIDNVCRILCPIFFIIGAEDRITPKEDIYKLFAVSKNPASQLWVVEGADHSKSYLTYPDEYVAKVLSFLKIVEIENNVI